MTRRDLVITRARGATALEDAEPAIGLAEGFEKFGEGADRFASGVFEADTELSAGTFHGLFPSDGTDQREGVPEMGRLKYEFDGRTGGDRVRCFHTRAAEAQVEHTHVAVPECVIRAQCAD